ncbi:MAG: hypothetical protein LBM70_08820 [Victivallales bacterium]|nr:hypothetical protein [Victivallales bacterium]
MKTQLTLFIAGILITVSPGCSFLGNKTQELSINVEPADSRVLINNKWYTSPVRLTIPTGKSVSVTATHPGYVSETQKLRVGISKLGILDLVGAAFFLLPAIGFLSDGAYQVQDTDLYFQLDKQGEVEKIHQKILYANP